MPLRIRLRPREERSEARYSGGDEVRGSPRRLAVPALQAKKRRIRSALTKRTGRYCDTNRLTEAEKLYLDALAIRRGPAEQHPEAYEPDVAAPCSDERGHRTQILPSECKEAVAGRRSVPGSRSSFFSLHDQYVPVHLSLRKASLAKGLKSPGSIRISDGSVSERYPSRSAKNCI